jgi:DNA-directed RNA polymerase subunit delta
MGFELSERIAYLQGLASGLGVDGEAGPEGEVLAGILDVLQDMAQTLDATRVVQSEIAERVEDLSSDMMELAEEVMGEVSGDRWEVTCPHCRQVFTATGAALEDDDVDLVCPNCGQVVHDFDSGLDSDEEGDEVSDRR